MVNWVHASRCLMMQMQVFQDMGESTRPKPLPVPHFLDKGDPTCTQSLMGYYMRERDKSAR